MADDKDPKAQFKEWLNEALDERDAKAKADADAKAKADADAAKPKGILGALLGS